MVTILVNYPNQSCVKTTKSKYDFPTFQLIMVKNRIKNITFPLEIAGVPSGRAKQKALELVELVGLKGRECVSIRIIRWTKAKSRYS